MSEEGEGKVQRIINNKVGRVLLLCILTSRMRTKFRLTVNVAPRHRLSGPCDVYVNGLATSQCPLPLEVVALNPGELGLRSRRYSSPAIPHAPSPQFILPADPSLIMLVFCYETVLVVMNIDLWKVETSVRQAPVLAHQPAAAVPSAVSPSSAAFGTRCPRHPSSPPSRRAVSP